MASYKAGFDPPTRPGDATRTRRMGTYIQQPAAFMAENREADIAGAPAQAESRVRVTSANRPQQTGLPRPGMRGPSPIPRSMPEAKPEATTASRFGFGKGTAKPLPVTPAAPLLKGKSSRNVLRRKPSNISPAVISQHPGARRPTPDHDAVSPVRSQSSADTNPNLEASLKSAEAYNEIFTRSRRAAPAPSERPLIPELDRYRTRPEQNAISTSRIGVEIPHKLSTQDLPPPTPSYYGMPMYSSSSGSHNRYSGYSGSGYSASPSTRHSESPGPGAYSRDTTPTSVSSVSPGIMAPMKTPPRLRQATSPVVNRPPPMQRRTGSTPNEVAPAVIDPSGLPALRESATSSSSNSTVKADGKGKEKKKKKKMLSPLPPSPPPRKSSQKFKKTHQPSPTKPPQASAKYIMQSQAESSLMSSQTPISPSRDISRPFPPRRPSRDGAPDLKAQLGDSYAIMHNNVSNISLHSGRRDSYLPRNSSPAQPQASPRPQQDSRVSSRNPSPVPILSKRAAIPNPAPTGLGIIPNLKPAPPTRGILGRTPSPSVENTRPRFGLFGRRAKTTPEIPQAEKEKPPRKGPAAGTGHEGYGRYAVRGRSNSATSLGRGVDRRMSGAASPQESPGTNDAFFLERMSPVIISGGAVVENRNASSELSRTGSSISLVFGRPSLESARSNMSPEVGTTLWPSAMPRELTKRSSGIAMPKYRRPSDSSDDGMGPPIGIRRSIQRLNNSSASHVPKALNIAIPAVSASTSSLGISVVSDESYPEMKDEAERGRLTKPRKPEKRAKSPRKWNFFHRQPTPKPQAEVVPAVKVTVGRPPIKAIPHYAILDSSDDPEDAESVDLADILRDSNEATLSNDELDALQFDNYKENLRRIEDLQVVMAPSLPEMQPATTIYSSPEPMITAPEIAQTDLHLTPENAPVRPSRLPQVGRIPKVISARPEATSPKSFSRPFARLSTIQPPFGQPDNESIALGLGALMPLSPEEPTVTRSEIFSQSGQQIPVSPSEASAANHRDFLAFSPRKNSEGTTTSSSGGTINFAGTIAVIPEPDAALVEDEVWDEYDDLIGNKSSPMIPPSATSSQGVPFQYESYESQKLSVVRTRSKRSPGHILAVIASEPPTDGLPQTPRRSDITSSHVSMTSRLREALNGVLTPSTSSSFSELFSGYADRNQSVLQSAQQLRRTSDNSSQRSRSSNHSYRSASTLTRISANSNTSPISQVNLRVGSMTVSKWLTFGHVLFSPGREEMMQVDGQSKRCSILVIDGLGNDDWSFYAAETYPTSTFYNLSPTAPIPSQSTTSSPSSSTYPLSPPNHHQIQHPPLTSFASSSTQNLKKFPFPSSTFSLVIFRFPPCLPSPTYHHILTESFRVLKPGGYLELAILDLDMMNMGPRTRRAVRGLKMRLRERDGSVELGSASDLVMRMMTTDGKRGCKWVDVKSCKVGVPVATVVSASPTSSPESSNPLQKSPSKSKNKGKGKAKTKKEEPSLAEMMKDSSPAGDESITKMVAKVGRWWYTRCYESALLQGREEGKGEGGEGSIFGDMTLLEECEKWNASFKLVVAYAQKPEVVGRRRTNSL